MGLCPEGVPAHSLLPTSKVPVGALGSAAAWPHQLSPSSSVCHIQHALSVTNCFDSCPQLGDFVGSCVLFHLLLSVWSRRELGREEAAMGGTRLLLSLTPEQLPSAEGMGMDPATSCVPHPQMQACALHVSLHCFTSLFLMLGALGILFLPLLDFSSKGKLALMSPNRGSDCRSCCHLCTGVLHRWACPSCTLCSPGAQFPTGTDGLVSAAYPSAGASLPSHCAPGAC